MTHSATRDMLRYRKILECIDDKTVTRDEREKEVIRMFTEQLFEQKESMNEGKYVKVCWALRHGYQNGAYRRKVVRKIVDTIRKHESESRRPTQTRAIFNSR